MQATHTVPDQPEAKQSGETVETAAKLGALFRYLFANDGGKMLRAVEESGVSLSAWKALLLLSDAHGTGEPLPLHELAAGLGLSIASVSRGVDVLVRKRMVTRVADKQDRRVRRIAITPKGQDLVDEIVAARMEGLERFAATLTKAERRKLDAALDALLAREDIARSYEEIKEISR